MIDRIIPRFYASDKDQRFTDEGVMVEALNVTLTESDEKTGNVLKNTKSNVAIPADATAQLQTDNNGAPRDVTIIGSIEDDKNNHIYFFVGCPTTANIYGDANHPVYSAIFRYELETLSYTKILDNVHLKFDSNSFIKADIIHGTFGKNVDEQPIIYFTDNINPPRKINVSRALLGEYDLNSARDFNYAASTMRAAPTKAPDTSLESDTTVSVNSIDGNFFQFACQIVYADGEESALGPYSDLAICRPTFLNALTSTAGQNFGVERLVDNVINVDLNIDLTIPGIDKINVLCRNGNEGTWFIADSFEPYVDVSRNISGVEKLVFEAGGNRYKFYNDSIGQLVPPVTTQKNFDNVPLVARGQSIIKNRLFYSNYEEGFENVDAGLVTIQDIYSESQAGSSEAFPSSVHNDLITQENCDPATGTSNMDVVLDLTEGVGYTDENTAVGAGTKYSVSFQWAPSCTLSNGGDNYLRYTFPLTYRNTYVNDEGGLSFGISRTLGEFTMDFDAAIPLYYVQADSSPGVNIDSIPIKAKDGNVKNKRKRYSFDYTLGTDGNLGDVAIGLSNEMLDSDLTVRYTYCMPLQIQSTDGNASQIEFNDNIDDVVDFGEFDSQVQGLNSRHKVIVTWDFEVFVEDAKICLRPFISDIELDTPLWFGPDSEVWDGTTNLTTFSRSAGDTSVEITFFSFDPLAIYNANDNPNAQQAPASGASISLGTPTVTLEENSNDADDLTYTALGTSHIQNRTASALSVSVVPTFKSGSTHSFGIVYYDEYGRHGFVNPIGSMYSKYPNERVTGTSNGQGMFLADGAVEGVCSARIELSSYSPSGTFGSFSNKVTPPSWAKSWQIVYAGSNLTESFIQYEAFSAYPELKVYTANNVLKKELDEETMRIYVRLENLNEYQTQRGVSKSYSFTKGDKLRVIKYKELENSDGTGPFKFPTASDSEDLTNSIIEFDVVGNVVLTRSLDNPIDPATTDADLADGGKYSGEFIILEAPRINTGVLGYNSQPLRYPGFDWQHVAKFRYGSNSNALLNKTIRYQDGTEQTNGDLYRWGKRSIVEILTPQRSTAEKVYYEIGVGGNVTGYVEAGVTLDATGLRGGIQQNNHGLSAVNGYVTTSNGDAWYRPVAMRGPKWFNPSGSDPNNLGGGAGNGFSYTTRQNEPLASSVYSTQIVEDSSLTDKISSKSWSKGRPHVAYEKAKRIRRYNSITFSEPFNSDVQELTLSSFNAALLNFGDLSNKYGAINYIGNYEDMLFAAQENKVSITPVERATLNQAAGGDGVVSLSSAVLNDANTNYMAGDWGVGDNPESVLIYDTQIFFADPSRARVVRLTREGLSPISDKGLSEVFNKEFKKWLNYTTPFKRVVSGYDPSDNVYYISLVKDENNTGKTYGYDVQRGVWQSEYSFVPNLYSRQNDDMFSFKQTGNDIMWVHNNNDVRNTFYGSPFFSNLKVISKFNPSMSKIYKAIGINGGTAMDTRITSSVGHDTGSQFTVMPASSYALREGQHYREIPGDTSNVDAQHFKGIGKCLSVSNTVLNMEDLSGINIPIDSRAHYVDNDGNVIFISAGVVTGVNYETNQITLATGDNAASGRDIVISFSVEANGNPEGARIRGHYVEVFLQSALTSISTPFEIYSIDLNYENSKPNYALGQ